MRRFGSIDVGRNLKLRGVVVDDLTTQGGFYSEQFGEVAYKSDLTGAGGGGFYGIYVVESDGNPPAFLKDTIIFDSLNFYLNSDSFGRPIISLRSASGGSGSIFIEETDDSPPTFTASTLIFDSTDFYLSPDSVSRPVVSLRTRFNNAYLHTQSSPSAEWVVQHNFNSKHFLVQTFDRRDRVIGFDEADTSDANTAYFYFTSAVAGKAILTANQGVLVQPATPVDVKDEDTTFNDIGELNFSSNDFYLTADNAGNPVVNLVGGLLVVQRDTGETLNSASGETNLGFLNGLAFPGPTNSLTKYMVTYTQTFGTASTSGQAVTLKLYMGSTGTLSDAGSGIINTWTHETSDSRATMTSISLVVTPTASRPKFGISAEHSSGTVICNNNGAGSISSLIIRRLP